MGMNFDEEVENNNYNLKCNLSTFSKSFGDTFKECPLKAWFLARDRNRKKESSREMEIGKYSHELFAQKISEDFLNKTYKVKTKGIDPTVIYESSVMMTRLNIDTIIEKGDTVIAVEEFHKYFMKNGLELVGIFDLVLLKQSAKGPYIQVFDLKTSYKVAKEVDLQCMIYSYLAAITYPGLPVLFTTYSIRTGDTWGKFFSEKDALALGDIIENFSSEVKDEVESEYKPIPKCSVLCKNCQFFDDCTAGKEYDEADPESVMNAYINAKSRLERLEGLLKSFRLNSKDDKPILTTGFVVDINESISNSIATKKATKDDLKVLIANSKGGLNEVLDAIDIKLTDKVVSLGKELGLDFKPRITKKLSIKPLNEEIKEEGETNE